MLNKTAIEVHINKPTRSSHKTSARLEDALLIALDSIPDNAQTWDDTTLPISNGFLQHLVLYLVSNGLLKLKLIALLWCKDA